jgi:D-sedoheptulose 7-phosphate isomerase
VHEQLDQYFDTLAALLRATEVTDRASRNLSLDEGCEWVRKEAHDTHAAGNKLMFIGNGGSAGIASHLAIDFSKNGGLRSLAFNDPSALTCLGNDLGYENVFAKQLDLHARPGDLLIAISSSGRSPNILGAVKRMSCGAQATSTFMFVRENTASLKSDIWRCATPSSTSIWAGGGRLSAIADWLRSSSLR